MDAAPHATELRASQGLEQALPRVSEMSRRQRWLYHPETTATHRFLFQIHLLTGMAASLYVFAMSLSGSAIVFRNELEGAGNTRIYPLVEWLVNFHSKLMLSAEIGGLINGIGAIVVTLLCVTGAIIWWPGGRHWRRSLTINWKTTFARRNWELHNALGIWCLLFVMLWGVSGIYFAFPEAFNHVVNDLEGADSGTKLRFGDQVLTWLSNLHFGRFNRLTETIWVVAGLVPAILSFTGMFMCCHRLLVRKGARWPR